MNIYVVEECGYNCDAEFYTETPVAFTIPELAIKYANNINLRYEYDVPIMDYFPDTICCSYNKIVYTRGIAFKGYGERWVVVYELEANNGGYNYGIRVD